MRMPQADLSLPAGYGESDDEKQARIDVLVEMRLMQMTGDEVWEIAANLGREDDIAAVLCAINQSDLSGAYEAWERARVHIVQYVREREGEALYERDLPPAESPDDFDDEPLYGWH